MPANANIFYEVIYKIANFELFSSVTESIETWMSDHMSFAVVSNSLNSTQQRRLLSGGITSPFAPQSKFETSDLGASLGVVFFLLAIFTIISCLMALVYCLF